jgi:hypothetical protein
LIVSGLVIGGAGLTLVVVLVGGIENRTGYSVVLPVIALLIIRFAGVLFITGAALIFLLVDQARNVRHLNHRLERMELLIMSAMQNRG